MNKRTMKYVLKKEAEAYIDEFIELFAGKKTIFPVVRPEIKFEDLGEAGGFFNFSISPETRELENVSVSFNERFMTPENITNYLNVIVPHEIAHWGAITVVGVETDGRGIVGHGKWWKMMMNIFDIKEPRRASPIVMPEKKGYVRLACECSKVNFKRKVVERMRDEDFSYECGYCDKAYSTVC